MSIYISPLANPKGINKLCELCNQPARLQCKNCRVTFYCNVTHQQADWNSIHEKVCELLITVRTPLSFCCFQADREFHHIQNLKRLEHITELSHAAAKSWMLQGKYSEAMPAAQLSLRCAIDIYGPDVVELVPAYLLLAEASIGLGSLSQAKNYLSQAEWMVKKNPGCSRTFLHLFHRALGRLYLATGDYRCALLHFANDVYYASEEFGVDSVVTAGGYFLIADVFMKQGKTDITHSLYTEVASIWHTHLSKMMEFYNQEDQKGEQYFDSAQCAEVNRMLSVMLEAQQQDVNAHPACGTALSYSLGQKALVSHSLAMLWFLCNDHMKALDFGKKAAEFSQRCEHNNLAESIQSLIQQAETHLNAEQTAIIHH
ncbi:zinc finger MYND domain-containing protein 12 isoform X1 [Clarias gariepinus]|uniref:zinc finger MYND domain-containing protein 12 isoform X1 n=1 Tax=Clarias gariepinus TaxID=13013 RepID=UPI00234CEC71|nr:zinc finger MYND domain-containing protein 12 isoform X1 [Clarias gariepinus]